MKVRTRWLRALLVPLAVLACAAHTPGPEHGGAAAPSGPSGAAQAPPMAATPTEPADTTPAEPPNTTPTAPEPAPAAQAPLRCLPFATCGCFHQPECVAGRVRDDGYTFDIVGGPRDGETAHLSQDCPDGAAAPAGCRDYVDPAMICRRLRPADVRAAKYLCAVSDAHPDWECGFRSGACSVL